MHHHPRDVVVPCAPAGDAGASEAPSAPVMVSATIDGISVEVPSGTTILKAAREIGVHIPTLCDHPDLRPAGVCRICVVQVEGMRALQPACTTPILQPIAIDTKARAVRTARRHIVDLMLANHYGECYACKRNNNCELQSLAKEYGVDFFRFGHPTEPRYPVDHTSDAIVRDMNKCVLCRRCVRTCAELQAIGCLTVKDRSARSMITTFGDKSLAAVVCINCGQCINRCPTGALTALDQTDEVWRMLDDPSRHVVIQTAPSPRAAIGECFGQPPGTSMTGQMNTALRRMGFDGVFDTNHTADLTILEEGTELILRLYNALAKRDNDVALPQFTSCSPGWVKYVEHVYPDMIPNLSTAKSPQQMFGALLKTYYAQQRGIDPRDMVVVSVMPCTAKKYECNRPEMCDSGFKDVDFVVTTRELAKMISEAGIDLPNMPKSGFDEPFYEASGAGMIFGATGGVMEAALRTVIELVTGQKVENFFDHANIVPVRGFEGARLIEIPITEVGPVPDLLKALVPDWEWLKGVTLKVGVAHGIANARQVVEDIKAGGPFSECHFIEVMACPGGCLGGGGQPIPTTPEIRAKRAQAIYEADAGYALRKSHENPVVLKLYEDFLTDGPCGHQSHHLLHTDYTRRGKFIS
ncbi:NADP-reducing hydrogenase subunit HndD [Rhodovastum atsumiense]|uniref:Hydrogenase n=1 Tax=Rhodovastum atsumiense TaxID=504468 RepID=A0A5M6IW95_9PROT|nr:NADH-dependent [FeFe] hydrogenase, group A6 [Rhodovastum atsumiense]KAA5612603.1 hydrogenase [Rhodovastum atsumiense]CAH2601298.1 NADP-reducing hydrogenase subunit HndD [Rhodovastum atsumiense]